MRKDIILNEFGRIAEATGKDFSCSPKSLAMNVSVEAAKLLNNFQWMSELDSQMLDDEQKLAAISADVADVYIYLTVLCHKLGVDPWVLVKDKLLANREKHLGPQQTPEKKPMVDIKANVVAAEGGDWASMAKKIAESREQVRKSSIKLKKKAGSR